MLIKSGLYNAEEVADEFVSLVGEHVEDRIEAMIKSGEGDLWMTRPDGCLQIVEAFDVR